MIILPRQARDKRRENSKRDAYFAGLILTALGGTSPAAAAASSKPGDHSSQDEAAAAEPFGLEGVVAVACLAGALLARALTGGLQEAVFAKQDGARASADEIIFFQNIFGEHEMTASWGGVLAGSCLAALRLNSSLLTTCCV
jgi:hypothetical protein